ncbi:hypothetical protein ACFY5F_21740 [Streptomyces sp. NPDC013161]
MSVTERTPLLPYIARHTGSTPGDFRRAQQSRTTPAPTVAALLGKGN